MYSTSGWFRLASRSTRTYSICLKCRIRFQREVQAGPPSTLTNISQVGWVSGVIVDMIFGIRGANQPQSLAWSSNDQCLHPRKAPEYKVNAVHVRYTTSHTSDDLSGRPVFVSIGAFQKAFYFRQHRVEYERAKDLQDGFYDCVDKPSADRKETGSRARPHPSHGQELGNLGYSLAKNPCTATPTTETQRLACQ
jgi:hypothetical protein